MHRRPTRGIGGFFRHSMAQARIFGMGVDNFMRANGNRIRDVAATVAPLLAAGNPALAAGVATIGQGPPAMDNSGMRLTDQDNIWIKTTWSCLSRS